MIKVQQTAYEMIIEGKNTFSLPLGNVVNWFKLIKSFLKITSLYKYFSSAIK